MDGWKDEQVNEQMMEEWLDEWMDRRTGGWRVAEWMDDKRMDE